MVKKNVKKVAAKAVAPKTKKSAPNHASRVNRIVGQVGGIQRMIADEKNSVEIIIQLKAVRSAIKALEGEILEEHLQSSAIDLSRLSAAQKNKKISDLKKIFLKFE